MRYVVNTHWHPDHLFGNGAYRGAFPGVAFLGHAETRRLALLRDPAYVESQRSSEVMSSKIRAALLAGVLRGKPLEPDDRRELEVTLAALEQTSGDTQVDLVPPTETFTDSVTIHLGKREVLVRHLGRGNTAGDVVVYVPDARVLATGDLVVSPTPYGFGSYPAEWIATLQRLRALGATTLVPGHGPVQKDEGYVDALIGLIESVRAQVGKAVADGATLEQTRARVSLDDWKTRFAGGFGSRDRLSHRVRDPVRRARVPGGEGGG